ncbi:MAG: hypothetical protein KGK08_08730 [Acidobacteriota bacterium]|nr:hypothetical protein [Acidobacteriota bacterium]
MQGTDATAFCPQCGAPQLQLPEQFLAEPEPAGSTTGALPPPNPHQVEWRTAILCAALVGGIAALLAVIGTRVAPASLVSTIWVLTAPVTALTLYQSRRPLAWMDARVGARIGVLVGLALVTCVSVAMAIAGLVARFGLHAMGQFDAELTAQLQGQLERAATAATPLPPELIRTFLSPEFRVGMMLAGIGLMATVVLVLSTIGGAVGGMVRMRRHPVL